MVSVKKKGDNIGKKYSERIKKGIILDIHILHACIWKAGESPIKEVVIQTPNIETMTQKLAPINNQKYKLGNYQ